MPYRLARYAIYAYSDEFRRLRSDPRCFHRYVCSWGYYFILIELILLENSNGPNHFSHVKGSSYGTVSLCFTTTVRHREWVRCRDVPQKFLTRFFQKHIRTLLSETFHLIHNGNNDSTSFNPTTPDSNKKFIEYIVIGKTQVFVISAWLHLGK